MKAGYSGMWLTFLALLIGLSGCVLLVAAPFTIQNEFYEKREALKRDADAGKIGKGAATDACVSMLGQVERGHIAPPPVPPGVCDFGSPAAKRYELTRAVERGVISRETWVTECRHLNGQAEACRFDPFSEMKIIWAQMVKDGRTTKDAVEFDCRKIVSLRPAWMGLPENISEEGCAL